VNVESGLDMGYKVYIIDNYDEDMVDFERIDFELPREGVS